MTCQNCGSLVTHPDPLHSATGPFCSIVCKIEHRMKEPAVWVERAVERTYGGVKR